MPQLSHFTFLAVSLTFYKCPSVVLNEAELFDVCKNLVAQLSEPSLVLWAGSISSAASDRSARPDSDSVHV